MVSSGSRGLLVWLLVLVASAEKISVHNELIIRVN